MSGLPQPKAPYTGKAYWVSQLVALGGMAVVPCGVGGFLMFASLGSTSVGLGFMLVLCGIPPATVFVVFFRKYLRSTAEERAVYAWVVMQQHTARSRLSLFKRARWGNQHILTLAERSTYLWLTAEEIAYLQAMRPDVPYPGPPPENSAGPSTGLLPGPLTGPWLPGPPAN